MGYDVFISFSSRDAAVAHAACAAIEKSGPRCWIAPRDITPGMDWSEAILSGITTCRVMVLVFSHHANVSPQVSPATASKCSPLRLSTRSLLPGP
jgi:hypothetical protein